MKKLMIAIFFFSLMARAEPVDAQEAQVELIHNEIKKIKKDTFDLKKRMAKAAFLINQLKDSFTLLALYDYYVPALLYFAFYNVLPTGQDIQESKQKHFMSIKDQAKHYYNHLDTAPDSDFLTKTFQDQAGMRIKFLRETLDEPKDHLDATMHLAGMAIVGMGALLFIHRYFQLKKIKRILEKEEEAPELNDIKEVQELMQS